MNKHTVHKKVRKLTNRSLRAQNALGKGMYFTCDSRIPLKEFCQIWRDSMRKNQTQWAFPGPNFPEKRGK